MLACDKVTLTANEPKRYSLVPIASEDETFGEKIEYQPCDR